MAIGFLFYSVFGVNLHTFCRIPWKIGDREVIHKDPIQQVNLQHFQLSEWLNHYNFPKNIPILSIVNDNARIVPMNNHDLLVKKVIRNTKIRDVLNDLHATYDKEILSQKDLHTL
ncbi:hypothetical protein [Alkalihalobacillus sp. TS-13]|uniref:hypothetical protein n=1 Tax=Alkalihalobacillus sp. TS-13 TaxID=2842455 RepID=UPI001C86CC6B|nr:hypothetical protein [Alkalihalobacillus sp. TS-13]